MRLPLLVLLSAGAALAGPVKPGEPRLSLRLEALAGQPTTLLPMRAGGALGVGYRMTDQVWLVADVGQRAAPGGGLTTAGGGLQAFLDLTPVAPFLELSILGVLPRSTAAYSVAARTGFGADWQIARSFSLGAVVRQFIALDPVIKGATPGGTEAALRFVYAPGGR